MNQQHHGILLAGLPSPGLDEKAVNRLAIRARVRPTFDRLKFELLPQTLVLMGQLAFSRTVQVGHVKVVEVLEIIGQIHNLAGLRVHIESRYTSRS